LVTVASGAQAEVRGVVPEAPKIDLYTMGVGDHFTEKFGHAALCTRYPRSPRRDRCYNYGTTNFGDPTGLGWDLLRGRSLFWVSVTSPKKMMDLYTFRDRTVWVQEMPFTDAQAKGVADKLHFDSLEANRYYLYHHFYDNCTTRVRDILDEHSGGALRRGADKPIGEATYRDFARRGFAHMPVLSIVSDYVLGRMGDDKPSEYEAMFLPEVFRESVRQRFGVEPVQLYERAGPELSQEPGSERVLVVIFSLLLVAPLWWCLRQEIWRRFLVAPAVLGLFLGGLVLWSLAVLSPLPMARHNENLLLFFPGDILLLFLSSVARQRYAQLRVLIVLLATAGAGIGILVQPLWAAATLPVLTLLPFALGMPEREKKAARPETPADTPT
jgi:hypothetical protein